MIDAFVAERLFDVDVLMSLSYAQDASVCAQRNKEQEANYSISTLLARIYNDKLGNAEQAIFYLKESAEYADSPMQWLYINNRLGIIEGERGNVTLVLDHFKKTLEDAESCESGCAG